MTVIAPQEGQLEPGITEFLKCHGAEAAFQTVRELVRACFPQYCAIEVRLVADPDEEDRRWVVWRVLLPASCTAEQLRVQRLRYYEELVSRLPFTYRQLFGLVIGFVPE